MGTNILRNVPLTESNRAVPYLHYSFQSTLMTSVVFLLKFTLKALKDLVQDHPIPMFHIFYTPMTCASQLTFQTVCRPCFTG
eukprot:327780-Pelagomonas_calceolata.AAC.2